MRVFVGRIVTEPVLWRAMVAALLLILAACQPGGDGGGAPGY